VPGPYPQTPHAPGPYPPPGQVPGPYGYGYGYGYGYPGAGGWYPGPPPNQSTNGLAIASLTVSIAAFCVPLVALLLGVFGLRKIRRTGQRGRGLAIAGIVINSVATALVALFVVLGVVGAFDEGDTDVQDLQVGQCFNTVGDPPENYGGGGHRASTVNVVSCDDEHDAETYGVFSVADRFDDDYPGAVAIAEIAGDSCRRDAEDYLGDDGLDAALIPDFYVPPRADWAAGGRSVVCFFTGRSGKVTGSVRNSDRSDGGSGGDSAPSVGV
jgi:hypothetical protein